MNKRTRAHLFLLTTAFIWGSAFVAQKEAMSYIGPFAFTGIRMLIGGTVLIPIIIMLTKKGVLSGDEGPKIPGPANDPNFIGGFFCGTVLFLASVLQQIGLVYTTAGKAGFITALFIVIVPLLGLFMNRKVSKIIWLCVAVALVGVYLLCMQEDFTVNRGDLIILMSSFCYALHIVTIDYFSPRGNPVKISCIQFYVCGILCIPTAIVEAPMLSDMLAAWFPIFYAGFISCGIAFTLQVIAQRDTKPTIAALILSLESVFAVLMGFIILSEVLSLREVLGCLLMFAAIIMAQLPEKGDTNEVS